MQFRIDGVSMSTKYRISMIMSLYTYDRAQLLLEFEITKTQKYVGKN